MSWYFYIAILIIASQILFLVQVTNNFRYALAKYKKKRPDYLMKAVLIVPCKGLDANFDKNISSFFHQDYRDYALWFVVAEQSDPAYRQLCTIKERLVSSTRASEVRIFVAGIAKSSGQKVHNLLHCYRNLPRDVEAMAFADSDICVRTDWLSHLIYPLRQAKTGASSGYRWYVPARNNAATLALAALNAKVAQLLGNTIFNQVWGGSMAIRAEIFRKLGLDKIWETALSDDLSLSCAVKKTGLKVAFVPACLAASYESTTWPKLFEFGRRQFLITRIAAPKTWLFGLCSSFYAALGPWITVALAMHAAAINDINLPLFTLVPVVFLSAQMCRAALRQGMCAVLLKKDLANMKIAIIVDLCFFWLWSGLMLALIVSSAFGRTITWRGIRYRLLGPAQTAIIENDC